VAEEAVVSAAVVEAVVVPVEEVQSFLAWMRTTSS
jgi:hypothetical protein